MTKEKKAAIKANAEKTARPEDLLFMVVDDDVSARKTIIEYLISFGFTDIREANHGGEALKILGEEKIDFIISDWVMPGVSGLDLLTQLRSDARYKDIPFIMVTSQQSKERIKVEKAAFAKVNAYVIKPFRSQTLKDKIDTLLAHTLAAKSFQARTGALVVDDDPSVLETVTEYLKELGYDPVYQAKDGEEGFARLKDHADRIAFVLSDWEMPKIAGIELLRKIRTDKELQSTPFIMITSQTSIERLKLKNAIEAHVDHYLLKPFKVAELKEKVNLILNRAKKSLEIRSELDRGRKGANEHNWHDAEKAYEKVLKMDQNNVDAHLGLAAIQVQKAPQKGVDKAIQYIRAALKINPAYEQAYIELALLFERALSLEKAIAILTEGLNECNMSEKLHFHLGRLLLTRGLRDKGISELKKALEINPDMQKAKELLNSWATR